VAIVNEELVREFWSGANPLGKRIRTIPIPINSPWLTVVGVARNVRTGGRDAGVGPEIYVPLGQYPWAITPRHFLVRTTPDSNTAVTIAGIRKQLALLDPSQPISDVLPLESIVRQPLAVRNFLTWLLVAFGALALLLAGLGVYGVLSYAVTQRTQEMGIRMALGAEGGEVLRGVIIRGVALAFGGIASGFVGALLLTGYLRSQLYGVGPRDPVIFVVAPAILLAIAIAASYIPARRAIAVDPITALRYE
jgi:putative ABC transport system permease protein